MTRGAANLLHVARDANHVPRKPVPNFRQKSVGSVSCSRCVQNRRHVPTHTHFKKTCLHTTSGKPSNHHTTSQTSYHFPSQSPRSISSLITLSPQRLRTRVPYSVLIRTQENTATSHMRLRASGFVQRDFLAETRALRFLPSFSSGVRFPSRCCGVYVHGYRCPRARQF